MSISPDGAAPRLRFEERERATLSPYAAFAGESRGRAVHEPEHDYRTAFQRDRDRILHSKAFRRLKQKTQVFLAPEGAHYRTRLTHTLEVAQIARTAARALYLNEDLVEAIALGHDLGHTPFGHAGELVLNEAYPGGFNHSEQSLRIVEVLERRRNGTGLNLTWEVRDGIRNHSCAKCILAGEPPGAAMSFEAAVVSLSDAIAYINHDIDDALRGGVITEQDLPSDCLEVLGRTGSDRIDTMVRALVDGSSNGRIDMTPEIREATQRLRLHLYTYLYPCETISREIRKAQKILRELYDYLIANPTPETPPPRPEDPEGRNVVDFVAGMTDDFALQLYERLFFPAPWRP